MIHCIFEYSSINENYLNVAVIRFIQMIPVVRLEDLIRKLGETHSLLTFQSCLDAGIKVTTTSYRRLLEGTCHLIFHEISKF